VGFDAFVARLAGAGALMVPPPPVDPGGTQGGAAGAADLFFPAFAQPFHRLYAPENLQPPSGIGTSLPAANFALAAAPTFTALQHTSATPDPDGMVAYFRGRAVVSVCVRVTVNGADRMVPLGTTVGNLLDRHAAGPLGPGRRLEGLRMWRGTGGVVPDVGAEPLPVGAERPVRFDWGRLTRYGDGYDALALPILHGDRIEFGR
jgi:hypothetical protein